MGNPAAEQRGIISNGVKLSLNPYLGSGNTIWVSEGCDCVV